MSSYTENYHMPAIVWSNNEYRVVRLRRDNNYDPIQYAIEKQYGEDAMGADRFQDVLGDQEKLLAFDWLVRQLGTLSETECKRQKIDAD